MLLLLFSFFLTTVLAGCPNGTYYISEVKKCILLEKTKPEIGYFQAEQTCRDAGGNLVSVDNAFVNALLTTYANGVSATGYVYIGADDHMGTWRWLDGGAMTYTNWAAGQPTTGLGCAALNVSNGKWSSQNCGTPLAFMCELPYTEETVCPDNYSGFNGSCYAYHDGSQLQSPASYSWFDARTICQHDGGELASIHSAEENDFLATLAHPTKNCYGSWIGLLSGSSYSWSDGTAVTFNNMTSDKHGYPVYTCWQYPSCHGETAKGWDCADSTARGYAFVCKRQPLAS